MMIKMKDDKWATAVETSLKARNLRSFIVDNEENDGKLLKQLAEQAGHRGLFYTIQKFRDTTYESEFTDDNVPGLLVLLC